MSLYFLKCSKTFYFQRIHSWQTWNCCWSTDDCNLRHSSYTNTGHNWLLKFDLTEDLDWLVWMNTLINVIPAELPTVMQIRRKIFKLSNWLECWVFDPKKKGPNALPASNHCWVECLRQRQDTKRIRRLSPIAETDFWSLWWTFFLKKENEQ